MLKHQGDFGFLIRPLDGADVHQPGRKEENTKSPVSGDTSRLQVKTTWKHLPDHVRVVELLETSQQRHLSDRGDREAILVRLDTDVLQSHELATLGVPGFINGAVGAATNLCHRLVLETGAMGHHHVETD